MKLILCRIQTTDRIGEFFLFQLVFNCQNQSGKRLDIRPGVELHVFQLRENGNGFLQITGDVLHFGGLIRPRGALGRVGLIRCGGFLLAPPLLRFGTSAGIGVMFFLLRYFLVVGNVSWIGHVY